MATTALSCNLDLKSVYPKRVANSLLSLSVPQPLVLPAIIDGARGPFSSCLGCTQIGVRVASEPHNSDANQQVMYVCN